MKRLVDLSNEQARSHFLKGSSYLRADLPPYISFEPILSEVAGILQGGDYSGYKARDPSSVPNVNYSLLGNKDGRFAWRPYELIDPVIYVSLVNVICERENWDTITKRLKGADDTIVECCSAPVLSTDDQTDVATQVRSWWQKVEQRSLTYSLQFSHLLHTDVTNCYGSLYTHSIAWALHGVEEAKAKRRDSSLLGNRIDGHIRAGRYGQTNGISQGSVLMDLVAELVLGFVDAQISHKLADPNHVRILRYRDDYRIFADSDERAEATLKVLSDKLRSVGMALNVSKTRMYRNVVEGSIKPDKLAGIDLQDLGTANARTIQKQLLRLHSFGQRFPNSGALRRLVGEYHSEIARQTEPPQDLEVQVAIATDIAVVSPATFPAIAGILSHLIGLALSKEEKVRLWNNVRAKMRRVPYNGYLEIWLQRVTKPKAIGIPFESDEHICQIVNGGRPSLWNSEWLSNGQLKEAVAVSKIVVADAAETSEQVDPNEVRLFKEIAWAY